MALVGVAWWIGLSGVLLFIPSPCVTARLSQVFPEIVDRDIIYFRWPFFACGETSYRLTKGNTFTLVLLQLFALAMVIVAAIPFGIGLVVVLPYLHILGAVIYVHLTNREPGTKVSRC